MPCMPSGGKSEVNIGRFAGIFEMLQSQPLISLATSYTCCDSNMETEFDFSGLMYEPNENEVALSQDVGVPALISNPFASSSGL